MFFCRKVWWSENKVLTLHSQTSNNGTLTEWLGSGLQNRVQQFESAGYLKKGHLSNQVSFFYLY